MIANIDNISENEKTVAVRENIKVYIYTRLIFHCYAFVINSSGPVSHCSTIFTLMCDSKN